MSSVGCSFDKCRPLNPSLKVLNPPNVSNTNTVCLVSVWGIFNYYLTVPIFEPQCMQLLFDLLMWNICKCEPSFRFYLELVRLYRSTQMWPGLIEKQMWCFPAFQERRLGALLKCQVWLGFKWNILVFDYFGTRLYLCFLCCTIDGHALHLTLNSFQHNWN